MLARHSSERFPARHSLAFGRAAWVRSAIVGPVAMGRMVRAPIFPFFFLDARFIAFKKELRP